MNIPATPKLRIFVLEDHEDTLEYFRQYLELLGHEVVAARTLSEAAEILPQAGCQVLFSDIGLPDGSGWEILEKVQLPEPIYAVALSGYGMSTDKTRSLEAGFRQHLIKPPSIEALEAVLRVAADEHRRRP